MTIYSTRRRERCSCITAFCRIFYGRSTASENRVRSHVPFAINSQRSIDAKRQKKTNQINYPRVKDKGRHVWIQICGCYDSWMACGMTRRMTWVNSIKVVKVEKVEKRSCKEGDGATSSQLSIKNQLLTMGANVHWYVDDNWRIVSNPFLKTNSPLTAATHNGSRNGFVINQGFRQWSRFQPRMRKGRYIRHPCNAGLRYSARTTSVEKVWSVKVAVSIILASCPCASLFWFN